MRLHSGRKQTVPTRRASRDGLMNALVGPTIFAFLAKLENIQSACEAIRGGATGLRFCGGRRHSGPRRRRIGAHRLLVLYCSGSRPAASMLVNSVRLAFVQRPGGLGLRLQQPWWLRALNLQQALCAIVVAGNRSGKARARVLVIPLQQKARIGGAARQQRGAARSPTRGERGW